MKKNHLALTVTMISIGMILAVYILMQIIAFFRDNAILGLTSLAALPGSVVLFIAMYVRHTALSLCASPGENPGSFTRRRNT